MALTQSYSFLEFWKRSQLYTSADLNILPWFYLKDHLLEASREDTRNDCGGLKKICLYFGNHLWPELERWLLRQQLELLKLCLWVLFSKTFLWVLFPKTFQLSRTGWHKTNGLCVLAHPVLGQSLTRGQWPCVHLSSCGEDLWWSQTHSWRDPSPSASIHQQTPDVQCVPGTGPNKLWGYRKESFFPWPRLTVRRE